MIAGGGSRLAGARSVPSWPRLAWPGAGGTFVQQPDVGTSYRSSLLQKCPPASGAGRNCDHLADGGSSAAPLGCRVAPVEAKAAQLYFYLPKNVLPHILQRGRSAEPRLLSRLFNVALQDEAIAPQSEISFISSLWINWFPDKPAPD